MPHRYVHGGFTGTDAKFSFYFPPPEQYQRRFFQITHQLLTSENTTPGNIGFAVASGAYFVQTNIGGVERATTTEQAVFGNLDPTVGGYRVNAEAAKYSRVVAAEIYGDHRPFGYLYGGSGGAFQSVSEPNRPAVAVEIDRSTSSALSTSAYSMTSKASSAQPSDAAKSARRAAGVPSLIHPNRPDELTGQRARQRMP